MSGGCRHGCGSGCHALPSYDRRSGIGTVIALMLPYFVVLSIPWTAFFVAWHALGIPWGI